MPDKTIFGNDGPSNPDLPKSTFDKSYSNNLTCRFGRVYPCFVDMIPPNSTAHITPHVAFDMMPTVSPVQASIRCHVSYYRIPLRILQKSYDDFFSRVGSHPVPYIKRSGNWCDTGSLADYMGIPTQRYSSRTLQSRFPAHRYGYIARRFVDGSDLITENMQVSGGNVFLDDLFHQSLIHPVASASVLDPNDDLCSIVVDLNKSLYDGVFQFGHVLDYGDNVPTNGTFGASWKISLLALHVRRSSQHDRDYAMYNTPYNYGVPRVHDYVVVDAVNGELVHDNTPSAGVFEPFTNLSPGSYALTSLGYQVKSAGDLMYRQGVLAMKLSDGMLTEVNRLIADASEAGDNHHVVLVFAWSTYSTAIGWFGDCNRLEGAFGVSPSGVTLSFSNPVTTVFNKESDQTVQTNLLSSYSVPYKGISGNPLVNASVPVNSAGDRNPFVSYDGEDPQIPINAYTFRAYEFIHNYFFRNERVDPFIKDGQPTYNQFITNDGDGADLTTPVDFFNAPYEYDLFTTCMKTPQFGNAPLVGVTTNDENSTAEILMRGQRVLDAQAGTTETFDYKIVVELGADNRIVQISNYDEVADKPSVVRLAEAIRYGISINDFRSVNAFQIMQERFLKAGYCYPDLVQEFFGVRPPVGENYPEYLGGITREITVRKIQNLALSDSAALGEFAGSGDVSGHGERIECFSKEWSILMGVCWFSVTPVYSQKIDKHFLYSSYFDFYNTALMSIGPQPVYKKQLCPLQLPRLQDGSLDPDHINDVFGYNRPWSDLVSKQDEAHGEFRGSMYNYLLQRLFDEAPSLASQFLHINSRDLTDVFSYIFDTDKFFGVIRHEYFLKMPLPRVSIPRII